MAIAIKEYLGYEGLQVDWNLMPTRVTTQESTSNGDFIDPKSLMVDIEGIHVGPTRNYTWYTEEALSGSVPTWTKPYLRPLIMHHNEQDGKIIGRVRFASYVTKNTRSGTGALLFTCNVPDKEGKEQIQDGRLKTVSIGVIVHSATCSICGQDIAEHGPCEHDRGQKYDDKTCYWMIHSMEAKELSYVIVPSDIYAHNISIYKPDTKNIKESNKGVLNMSEATNVIDQAENTIISEDGNKTTDTTTAPVEPKATDATDYKKDYETLKAKYDELVKDNDTLKEDIQKLKDNEVKAKSSLDTATTLLDQTKKELQSAKDNLVLKEADIVKERHLREAVETDMIAFQKDAREALVQQVITLRESLGKSIDKVIIAERSNDSLKDSIKDLKEELSSTNDISKIVKPENNSIVENVENKKTTVKEDKKVSNIDLAESLENIFNGIIGSKTRLGN